MESFKEWLEINEGKKDACYHKVKSRYRVWPSAYACVPTKTSKALTKEGWKYHNELNVGDEILTYSLEKDMLEFQPIKNLFFYEDADTYVVQNGNTGWLFECTPNHKWVVKHSCNEQEKYTDMVNDMRLTTTEELLEEGSNRKLVISSNYDDSNGKSFNFKDINHSGTKNCSNFKLIEERTADVWCPETINGTWVMMQETNGNEIISITGNSGALVKCRKAGAANWGNSKNENAKELECSFCGNPATFVEMWDEEVPVCDECAVPGITEGTFDLEKSRGLKGWFDRNRGKGWIDCKKSSKGNLVSCGRKSASDSSRSYPACRPTLSACTKKGVRGKKSSKSVKWD